MPPIVADDEEDDVELEEERPARFEKELEPVEPDEEEPQYSARRGEIKSARDLFGEELCNRARNARDRLCSHLLGKISITISGKGSFLFDWTQEQPECSEAATQQADCKIELCEEDLLKLCSGMLNPQIAMLSDKICVTGRGDLAVYFFNLIAPRR